MVYEGGEGFTAAKEWVDFLMQHPEVAIEYTTSASIPGEYLDMLEEAEKKFGIPKEVMAAVIQRESSWDPFAENSDSKCFGLTGQHPDYYADRWKKLGFDPIKDKWNPRAQILAGAMVLADYCGKVDWNNYAKDENFKKGLLRYVGGNDATWYVDDIIKLAQSFARPTGWPVKGYTAISSPFDWRKDPITKELKFHYGIDIPCPTGTPIISVSAGKVISTGYNDTYGNHIRISDITHEYLYAHLSEILVSAGEEVTPGQTIGKSGSTGKSTGPHLHFGIKDLTCGDEKWVDPLLILTNE